MRFTPSLTGIGEPVHLVSPQVDLTTHVDDIVNHVLSEDLRDMVLVGYSYGGAVVTPSLEHVGDRVRELVDLDAFVPTTERPWLASRAENGSDRSSSAPSGSLRRPIGNVTIPRKAHGRRFAASRTRCEFHRHDSHGEADRGYGFGLNYIKATADSSEAPGGNAVWDAAERAKASTRWQYYEIETNHMVASNRPHELADLLVAISNRQTV
jgi:pimeloyl-ACP methyl ester carboxylesterase